MSHIEELAELIKEDIYGWCGGNGHSLQMIGYEVLWSGNGNHLEIGSLWGASAVMAALVKKENNLEGKVYCIDPMTFEGHEPCSIRTGTITPKRAGMMKEIFYENIRQFEVEDRIVFINKPSQPIPKETDSVLFSSAFIDGWHYGDTPLLDVQYAVRACSDFILLDDCPLEYYPDIERAFNYLIEDKKWILQSVFQRASLFRKRQEIQNIWDYSGGEKTPMGKLPVGFVDG